jgi:hypothetical protein
VYLFIVLQTVMLEPRVKTVLSTNEVRCEREVVIDPDAVPVLLSGVAHL